DPLHLLEDVVPAGERDGDDEDDGGGADDHSEACQQRPHRGRAQGLDAELQRLTEEPSAPLYLLEELACVGPRRGVGGKRHADVSLEESLCNFRILTLFNKEVGLRVNHSWVIRTDLLRFR